MTRTSPSLLGLPLYFWRLLLAASIVALALYNRADAGEAPCPAPTAVAAPSGPSWIFMPGRYSHDPATGMRVAQYAMKPPVEPLDDPRAVTSGYSRSRTVIRGADGSVDTYYRVQSYANGRGGLDAEWERFHDAWRGSTIAGGDYQVFPYGGFGYGAPYGGYGGYGGGYANGGHGGGKHGGQFGPNHPGYGPGYGYGSGFGYGPGYGVPDAGRLDPDGADGYREELRRTPNRQFYFTPRSVPDHDHHDHDHGKH